MPAPFALRAYERHGRDLATRVVLGRFLAGGAPGVLGASVTEYQLTRPSLWMYVGTGLAEEAVKPGAPMFLVRRHTRIRGPRAGPVPGATPGFGFAALESAGHAFDAAVSLQGVGLRTLLETEILREALTPFGHGPWAAVTGAALPARPCRRGAAPTGASASPPDRRRLPRRLPAARTVGLHARDRAVAGGPAHPRRTRRNALRPGRAAAAHRRTGPPPHPAFGGRPVPRRDREAGPGALAGAPRRRLEKYPLGV
ncbi:PrsW family intramembrane metalloprotease [Streptomyces sp. NBC_00659]|uniref:PrsW family glutamic-type intramembrane protease n=1 Tax=Streptomyces sp. NBC_00659 TaxID=2903669 RepID=UPI002E325DEB|nr:PrsW family glutamic-type intramembrane protease [Streptomyces sp. NBC_00659]